MMAWMHRNQTIGIRVYVPFFILCALFWIKIKKALRVKKNIEFALVNYSLQAGVLSNGFYLTIVYIFCIVRSTLHIIKSANSIQVRYMCSIFVPCALVFLLWCRRIYNIILVIYIYYLCVVLAFSELAIILYTRRIEGSHCSYVLF